MSGGSSLPPPVRRLIAVVTAAAIGCLVAGAAALALGWFGAQMGSQPAQPGLGAGWAGWWRPVAAAAVIAVLSQVRCSVRFGGQRYMLAMGEAGLVLAFGLVPPLWVLLLTAPAVAVATGLPPRRQAPVKALYNTAVAVAGTAAAIAGIAAVGATPIRLDSLVDLLGLGLAAVLFTGVCEIATSAVVAASSARRTLEVLRHDPVLKLVSLAGNLALAALVWTLAAVDPRLLLVPAALVVTLNSAYTGWIRLQAERRRRHELAAAVAQLAVDGPGELPTDPGAADSAGSAIALAEAAVLRRAATVTAGLFSADVVELQMYGTGGQPHPHVGAASLLHRHHVHAPELDYTGPVELAPVSLTTPAAAVPLRGEDGGSLGELRIAFATAAAGPVRLDEREAGDLAAIAAAVPVAVAAAVRQVRELQLRAAAEHQATHDPLTGLPNQRLLLRRAVERLSASTSATSASPDGAATSATGGSAALPVLAVIEVPGLPQLNRTLGHVAGDRLLTAVAGRLSAVAGPNDVLARLDGGRFAVLTSVPAGTSGFDRRGLPGPGSALLDGLTLKAGRPGAAVDHDQHHAEQQDEHHGEGRGEDPQAGSWHQLAVDLQRALSEPLELRSGSVSLAAAVGVAEASRLRDAGEWLRQAEVALAVAARSRVRVARYDPAVDVDSIPRMLLAASLRQAIADRQLQLRFHVATDLVTGEPTSVQVLPSWETSPAGPLHGEDLLELVAADLPDLQDAYLRWLLDTALDHRRDWGQRGLGVPLVVSMPPRALLDPALPDRVSHALAATAVPPDQLILAVDDASLGGSLDPVEVLNALRARGVQIAVDRLTGLEQLPDLPVTQLRLPVTSVAPLTRSRPAQAVLAGAIATATRLGLTVTALGVDTPEHLALLRDLGCHAGQGTATRWAPTDPAKTLRVLWAASNHAAAVHQPAEVVVLARHPRRPPRRS